MEQVLKENNFKTDRMELYPFIGHIVQFDGIVSRFSTRMSRDGLFHPMKTTLLINVDFYSQDINFRYGEYITTIDHIWLDGRKKCLSEGDHVYYQGIVKTYKNSLDIGNFEMRKILIKHIIKQ